MAKEKLTWKDSDAPDADGKFRDLDKIQIDERGLEK